MGRYINITVKDIDDRGEHAFIDFEGMVDGDVVMVVAERLWKEYFRYDEHSKWSEEYEKRAEKDYKWYIWVNWLHMSMDTGDWEGTKELDLVALEVLTFIEAYIPPPDKSISVLKCDV